jgi:TonB-linked SusC/RagA family outer membrane protein
MRKNASLYPLLILLLLFASKYSQASSGRESLALSKSILFQQDTVPKVKKPDTVKVPAIPKPVPPPKPQDTAVKTTAPVSAPATIPPAAKPAATADSTGKVTTGTPASQDSTAIPTTVDSSATPAVAPGTPAGTADSTAKPAVAPATASPATSAKAQDSITGLVIDATGPLPGVIVTVKGDSAKTATDGAGKFSIAAGPTATLVFSFIGYVPKEEPVNNRKTVNVVLQSGTKALKEVQIVSTGYGTVNRAKLTSAVSSISSEQIKNEVLPTITQAIQGKAGGVQVTQKSGSPGGGLNIRVRGTTSISASSDPLYVVDGIPVNSTTNFTGGSDFNFGGGTQGINILSSINPSDVQSVEVLKDAASSSIYGARAANGVVLITTKKGQPGTSTFSFNAYEGFSQVPNERKYKFMNTAQYQDYMKDYYANLPDASGNPTPVPAGILANPGINTDWQNEIFRTAPTRNYELSARGGSEKTQYYTSIGYMRQGGVIKSSDFSRISARLNLDHQHNDKLSFSTRINLTRAITDRVQEENSKEGSTKNGIVAPPNIPV